MTSVCLVKIHPPGQIVRDLEFLRACRRGEEVLGFGSSPLVVVQNVTLSTIE